MKIFSFKTRIIISFLLFLVSCGGVIGHIRIYDFGDVSSDKLEKAIQDLYKNDTTLLKKDKSMYSQVKNSNGSYYFVVFEDNKKYLFRCDLIDSEYTVSTELSLTTAVEWGRVMEFSSDISFWERRKYRKLFEKHILEKLHKELGIY